MLLSWRELISAFKPFLIGQSIANRLWLPDIRHVTSETIYRSQSVSSHVQIDLLQMRMAELPQKIFLEWKAMVEKSTGRKLTAIRTDNGGEFASKEFEAHLTREGVRHELTVPKTPEQNGVAERMNRTTCCKDLCL